MKRIGISIIFASMICTSQVHASIEQIPNLARQGVRSYPAIVSELVREGLHFTAIPYIKEYLSQTKTHVSKEFDQDIDEVVTAVGVRQFEVMPAQILARSGAPTMKYILAKKYFRTGKYEQAKETLNASIPRDHSSKPFALQLEGSIYALLGSHQNAVEAFKECIAQSEKEAKRYSDPRRKRQLEINRDTCIVGIPRSHFAAEKFSAANSGYLDLPKSSALWPEILFEEAWNSFYLRDFNRTLGKLVTYKAPVMNFVFNPEIEVLRSLTYLELCMWNDAINVVNDFYKSYEGQSGAVRSFMTKNGKDYKYFYLLAKSRMDDRVRGNELLNNILRSVTRDPAFGELYDAFLAGRNELERVQKVSNNSLKAELSRNLREALVLHRDMIGSYVRKRILLAMAQMDKAFEGMSYIKLEILARRKNELYDFGGTSNRSRGDIMNLQRTDKQYFWTFNGEFWADELGDYVFSLKSECSS
jgi:tetratricopeptide (TPR) repeat protein